MKKMFHPCLYCLFMWRLIGVFGDEVKSVSVIKGDCVTLHTDITELQRRDQIQWWFKTRIATINKAVNKTSINDDAVDGRFRGRLQLNDQTGDLTITNITTQHTGLYELTIIIMSNGIVTSKRFNVTVYARLPVPVIFSRVSSQCSSSSSSSVSKCVLLCSVLNMRDVSLSWYKGNSLLSSISLSDLNINNISLHLECLDDSYSCVLNNSISNQTQHLNTDLCQTCSGADYMVLILCATVGSLMIVTAVLIFWIYRKHRNTQQQVQKGEEEITYADPTFYKRQTHKPKALVDDDVVYAGVMRR